MTSFLLQWEEEECITLKQAESPVCTKVRTHLYKFALPLSTTLQHTVTPQSIRCECSKLIGKFCLRMVTLAGLPLSTGCKQPKVLKSMEPFALGTLLL